jgi:hypothetical protein
MRTDTISTVEERIGFIGKKFGLSETKIAIASQVSVSALTKACRLNKISYKMAHKVSNAFGIDVNWLHLGEGEPDKVKIANTNTFKIDNNIKDISNPKIIKMNVALTKEDSNSEAEVLVDEGSGFIGDSLYVVNVLNSHKLFFISADVLGQITLATPNSSQTLTKKEFSELSIFGVVRAILKKFN